MSLRDRNDRRLKLVKVDPRTVARFFDAATRPEDFVHVPRFKDLPEGYTVDAVHYEWTTQGFIFLIYHPSWRDLGDMESPPCIEPLLDYVSLPRDRVAASEAKGDRVDPRFVGLPTGARNR